MWNNQTKRIRETEPDQFLPYTRHVDRGVIALRNGAMMSMFKIDGLSFETVDPAQLQNWLFNLNSFIQSLADERLSFWTHIIKSRDPFYPKGRFSSRFSQELDDQYAGKMGSEHLFRNDLILTILWLPHMDMATATGKITSFFNFKNQKLGAALEQRDAEALEKLGELTSEIQARFKTLGVRRLELVERRGLIFSEPMEVLTRLISGAWREVPLNDGLLGPALYSDRVIFGGEAIEIREPDKSRFMGAFGLQHYPASTFPGMLNDVLTLPFEYVISQSFQFIPKAAARGLLSRKQNLMMSANDRAFSQAAQLTEALDALESNQFVMGTHHLTMMIAGPSVKAVQEHMAFARNVLGYGGAVVSREDFGLEAVFWGQLPGNTKFLPRSAAIHSRNFAAFSGFHAHAQGRRERLHWDTPTALLKTRSGMGYYFSFHVGDLGHSFICGPSGSGKTVLMNFLLAQAEKHNPKIVLFDKDRGSDVFIRALGGRYLSLKNGQPTGCAPLKALDVENPKERAFLSTWLKRLVAGQGYILSARDEVMLETALAGLSQLPAYERSLTAIWAALDTADLDGVAARLKRWTRGQALGWVFDGQDDTIDLSRHALGFDMTDFLDNAEIRTPLMMYLFHRVESLINGERIIIAIDEFWKALGDEAFRELARDKLKTFRKQNGMLVFATQSPADVLTSPISHTILEQCVTKIFFANLSGRRADYIDGFGLSEREFSLLTQEMAPDRREFIVKQENHSAICGLDLSGFDNALAVLSGRTSNLELIDQIIGEIGPNPDRWLPIFYERARAE